MKIIMTLVIGALVVACGGADNPGPSSADVDITFCSCTNEPIRTDAKAKACGALMESVSPEEAAGKVMACREQLPVPEGGPDLCFCIRTMSRDPEIGKACEALLPENMSPAEMAKLAVDCGR